VAPVQKGDRRRGGGTRRKFQTGEILYLEKEEREKSIIVISQHIISLIIIDMMS